MKNQIRSLVMVPFFTALTAVGAFIKIPIPYVPLTLQTLMVMFAALILGSRLGALSQLLYLLIGILGLPVFAQGGGPAYVLQPSFGFIIGFIPGAFIMGKIVEDSQNLTFFRTICALIAGQIIIYLIGLSYLYLNLNYIIQKPISLYTTLKVGFFIFIPGDILKTLIAAFVILPVRKRLALFQQ